MSKKHEKVCWVLNYIENLLILIATLTGSVSISAFASLVCIPIGITSPAIGLNFCVITARIKEYKSISKKKKKKQDKNSIINKNLISKALIDSNISLNQFVLINNSLKEFYDMLEEIKNSNDKKKFKLYIKQCYFIVWSVEKIIVVRTKNRRIMLLSKSAVCKSKNAKFLKEQEARGLLSNLTAVKVPILGDLPIINTKYMFNKF